MVSCRRFLGGMLSVLVGGCGGRTSDPAPRPVDPALQAQAIQATALAQPLQIIFDWKLTDRDARFGGKGVLRVQGQRARLDLFGPRGETYASAVLDELVLRLPPGADQPELPPPPLFWSVVGVFRPPPGAALVQTSAEGDRVHLGYNDADGSWRFQLLAGKLQRAEWTGNHEGRKTVELESADPHGIPRTATYRDWPAFLELGLALAEVHEVEGFTDEIWTLGGH